VNGYPSFFCSRDFFSSSMQMGSHIFSLLKNFYFQILYKLVPMSSFFKISMKLQVVDPTHEQIKFAQSSKLHRVFFFFFFLNKSIANKT
jgi:hypothetical protein